MSTLWIAITVIIVAVAGLAIWLFAVRLSANKPHQADAPAEPRRGAVQGGTHVGGGRSVAPRRDAEVSPDDSPDEPTIAVQRRGNSPLDL